MAFTIFRQDAVEWKPRDDGSGELVLFIYGAPPEEAGADFYDNVP